MPIPDESPVSLFAMHTRGIPRQVTKLFIARLVVEAKRMGNNINFYKKELYIVCYKLSTPIQLGF